MSILRPLLTEIRLRRPNNSHWSHIQQNGQAEGVKMKLLARLILFILACGTVWAQQGSGSTPEKTHAGLRPEMVVSTQWLADHLTDPHLVLVQVGGSPSEY